MRVFYTWICIAVTVIAAAAGDVLLALAMRRVGGLGELRQRYGFTAVIVRVFSSGTLFGGGISRATACNPRIQPELFKCVPAVGVIGWRREQATTFARLFARRRGLTSSR